MNPCQSLEKHRRKKSKKPTYYYVAQSDDEADTLKDKFWRDLEQGKVDVFGNDMYSKVKGMIAHINTVYLYHKK